MTDTREEFPCMSRRDRAVGRSAASSDREPLAAGVICNPEVAPRLGCYGVSHGAKFANVLQ